MTTDVIALTERMPDPWTLMAGLLAGGPDHRMVTEADGALIRLCDADGRPLVHVEAPQFVRTPGEVARLLGAKTDGPVWWTEIHAATSATRSTELAGVIATRLATQLGGTVWPPEATAPDGGANAVPGVTATAEHVAAQPAVDVLTDRAAVVFCDRPVVGLSAWLADALRAAAASGRACQIVTPSTTRLTQPARLALAGPPNRWVAREADGGYYDALSGARLTWQDGTFTSNGELSEAFRADTTQAVRTGERQLLLSFVTRHPADADLTLGGPVEAAWRHLTNAPPAGWGTAEPAGNPWSRQELTTFARRRTDTPTLLVVVGHPDRPALAMTRIARTHSGVEQDTTFILGLPAAGTVAEEKLPGLARELAADHHLISLLAQSRSARADLAVPAHMEGPPAPVAFALGAEEIAGIGLAHASNPPLPQRPTTIGPANRPGLYYPLTDGGWGHLDRLMEHLRGHTFVT